MDSELARQGWNVNPTTPKKSTHSVDRDAEAEEDKLAYWVNHKTGDDAWIGEVLE